MKRLTQMALHHLEVVIETIQIQDQHRPADAMGAQLDSQRREVVPLRLWSDVAAPQREGQGDENEQGTHGTTRLQPADPGRGPARVAQPLGTLCRTVHTTVQGQAQRILMPPQRRLNMSPQVGNVDPMRCTPSFGFSRLSLLRLVVVVAQLFAMSSFAEEPWETVQSDPMIVKTRKREG